MSVIRSSTASIQNIYIRLRRPVHRRVKPRATLLYRYLSRSNILTPQSSLVQRPVIPRPVYKLNTPIMSFVSFVYQQLFTRLPASHADYSGQTIIVTGSNTGLGKEAARTFTRLNAEKVIIAVRSISKGEAAKREIEQSTGRQGVLEVWPLDLASYESTMQFAERAKKLQRLDILLENAGVAKTGWEVVEKDEINMTVNVVSTLLLAVLLLPKLRESGSKFNITPHLTIVNTEVHAWAKFEQRKADNIFEKLSDRAAYDVQDHRYPVSKLVQLFAARELATRSKSAGKADVIINMPNPGFCQSELSREGGWGLVIMKFLLARSTEYGSRTLVSAVEGGPETHGQYLSNCQVHECAPLVSGAEGPILQARIWTELSPKLENIRPSIMTSI